MLLPISSSDDLVELYSKYIGLVESGIDETLELVFAPGVYGVASIGPIQLDLGGNPAPREPKIDVVIRGAVTAPVVFRDMGLLVNARSLLLENVMLTGRRQSVLHARVATTFTMRNCVVADNVWGGPWGGMLMQVGGTYGVPSYKVSIEDTWFVRNSEDSESAVLALGPATESFIEDVRLARVVLIDNRTKRDLDIREAQKIHVGDTIAIKRQAGGATLRYANSEQVLFERSTFVVEDPSAIAEADTRTWSSGLALRDSHVYARKPGAALPAGAYGAKVHDAAGLPGMDTVDEIIDSVIAGRLTTTTGRARLRDALGLTS
jgi:hypothetical protein